MPISQCKKTVKHFKSNQVTINPINSVAMIFEHTPNFNALSFTTEEDKNNEKVQSPQ